MRGSPKANPPNEPTVDFAQVYPIPAEALVPWTVLFEWIPQRVAWWVSTLRREIPPQRRRFFHIL